MNKNSNYRKEKKKISYSNLFLFICSKKLNLIFKFIKQIFILKLLVKKEILEEKIKHEKEIKYNEKENIM